MALKKLLETDVYPSDPFQVWNQALAVEVELAKLEHEKVYGIGRVLELVDAEFRRKFAAQRERIAEAVKVLGEAGLDALAVEPLSLRLGVTKGSFYWHFKDRRDLQNAVLDLWKEGRIRDIEKTTSVAPGKASSSLNAYLFGSLSTVAEGDIWALVVLCLGVVIVIAILVPIVEELMFRGLGFSLLERFGKEKFAAKLNAASGAPVVLDRTTEAAEALDHALVVVDGGVVGHDGIGGAESHDELAAALGEGTEVGVLGVEVGRELGGVGVDVRAEVDVLQFLVFAEDPVEKIQVPVRSLDGTAERDAVEDAFAGHGMAWSVEEFLQCRRVFIGECGVLLPR